MDIIDVILGVLLITLGIFLIKYYLSLVKKEKHGGLSINLLGAGVGFIIIGISLVIRELF
tara:strand:+ start:5748 stop:5927 length:180 start_codon:yes stop_codon:yes gene_type:complete